MDELIDQIACSLNYDYLRIANSAEYAVLRKLSKLASALKDRDIRRLAKLLDRERGRILARRYNGDNVGKRTCSADTTSKTKVAVYTAIFGGYDDIKDPIYGYSDVEYFIVTDAELPAGSSWKKIDYRNVIPPEISDNVRKARFAKTHPHILFPQHEFSVWVDASMLVVGDMGETIKSVNQALPIATNMHPRRNCLFDEEKACELFKRDDIGLMRGQVEEYRKAGMPEHYGLFETNILTRKHGDEQCRVLMERWWEEISCWSARDQLSLTYVLWSSGYSFEDVGVISEDASRYPKVRWCGHLR